MSRGFLFWKASTPPGRRAGGHVFAFPQLGHCFCAQLLVFAFKCSLRHHAALHFGLPVSEIPLLLTFKVQQHAPIPRRSTAGSVYRRFYQRCGLFSGFTYVRVSRRLNRRSSEPPVEPAVQPPVVVLLTTNSLLIEKSSQNYCVTNMAICCTFPN